MKTQSDIRKEVTKDIHISLLKDALNDLRVMNNILKRCIFTLCLIVVLAIIGIIGLNVYHQHRLFNLMENSETISDVNMTNDESYNNGSIIIREK